MSLIKSECVPGLPVIHDRGFTGILTGKFIRGQFTGYDLTDVIRSNGSIYHADLRLLHKYRK